VGGGPFLRRAGGIWIGSRSAKTVRPAYGVPASEACGTAIFVFGVCDSDWTFGDAFPVPDVAKAREVRTNHRSDSARRRDFTRK
jgi:hypothetical protein